LSVRRTRILVSIHFLRSLIIIGHNNNPQEGISLTAFYIIEMLALAAFLTILGETHLGLSQIAFTWSLPSFFISFFIQNPVRGLEGGVTLEYIIEPTG
jgi:hypothetical protein